MSLNTLPRTTLGFFPTPFASHVAVAGSLAFVVDGNIQVVDVSDPTAPVEIGSTAPGHGNGVAVRGQYAYVADAYAVRIVEITDPTTPVEVGSFPSGAFRVTLGDSFVYAADGAVRALDVSDPATPVEVGFFEPYLTGALEVALAGAHVYMPYREEPYSAHPNGFAVLTRCEMFADGFECGSTAAWATTVP